MGRPLPDRGWEPERRGGISSRQCTHAIRMDEIKTAKQLASAVDKVIPSDPKFYAAFCRKTLTSSRQARFFLRSWRRRRVEAAQMNC